MKLMPRCLAALAIVALCGTAATAQAQHSYRDGYGFGLGFQTGQGFPYPGQNCQTPFPGGLGLLPFGFGGIVERPDEPPYFAKFPPVYYSDIVRRPYGVSPWAAPPGITPVEMQHHVQPVRVTNPHFSPEPVPMPSAPEAPVPAEAPDLGTGKVDSQPMLDAQKPASTEVSGSDTLTSGSAGTPVDAPKATQPKATQPKAPAKPKKKKSSAGL